jgi:hypothetical protein
MRLASYVIGAVVVSAIVIGWMARRRPEGFRYPLALASDAVVRLAMSALFALFAVGAARHGGAAWLVFPFAVLCALWCLGWVGFIVWAWTNEKRGET